MDFLNAMTLGLGTGLCTLSIAFFLSCLKKGKEKKKEGEEEQEEKNKGQVLDSNFACDTY